MGAKLLTQSKLDKKLRHLQQIAPLPNAFQNLNEYTQQAFSVRRSLLNPESETQEQTKQIHEVLKKSLHSIQSNIDPVSYKTAHKLTISLKYAHFLWLMEHEKKAFEIVSNVMEHRKSFPADLDRNLQSRLDNTIAAMAQDMEEINGLKANIREQELAIEAQAEQDQQEREAARQPITRAEGMSEREYFTMAIEHAHKQRDYGFLQEAYDMALSIEDICPIEKLKKLKEFKHELQERLSITCLDSKILREDYKTQTKDLESSIRSPQTSKEKKLSLIDDMILLGKQAYLNTPSLNLYPLTTAYKRLATTMKQPEEAMKLLNEVRMHISSGDLLTMRTAAIIHFQMDDYETGVRLLEKLHKQSMQDVPTLRMLTNAHMHLKNYEQAYHYAEILSGIPRDSYAQIQGLYKCYKISSFTNIHLDKVSDIISDAKYYTKEGALGHLLLGRYHWDCYNDKNNRISGKPFPDDKSKHLKQALYHLGTAYKRGCHDDYIMVHVYRQCLHKNDDYQTAQNVLNEFAKKRPNSRYVLYAQLREAAFAKHDITSAQEAIDKLNTLHPHFMNAVEAQSFIAVAETKAENDNDRWADNLLSRYQERGFDI